MRTYLEIGTSDFDTLNDKFADRDDWRGVSVEAVPEYFNRLRKHPKNTYVNAICSIDSADPVEFHYVPSEVIASHNLPQWLRGCGSMSLETQPSLQAYRPYVRTETLRRVLACDVLALEPFRDALTGACRIDLLKTDTEGYDFPLLNAILDVARPTNIIFETRFMSPAQFLALDDRLRRMGYRYRGRDGDSVQYSRKSVLLVADVAWSTGSIARDLRCLLPEWDVNFIRWDSYPRAMERMCVEHDAVAAFSLMSPLAWPILRNHGVFCCGPVELEMVRSRGGVHGACFGAVSRELYHELTRLPNRAGVHYTPASARASRFRSGSPRPIRRLGWCGVPKSAKHFDGDDAKRFSMFDEIATRTGLEFSVSHKNFSYDTMQEFYDAIDLLVCTSSSEGGPLPVFEAIASGVPVISTDVGLVKEAASIHKFASVDEAVAMIERLMRDPLAVSAYRQAQQDEFAARWSMERLRPYWEEFFEACARFNAPSLLF